MLLEIPDYNGTENDPVVTVKYYMSNGLNPDADGGIPTPKFDGTDRWTIDPSSTWQRRRKGSYSDDAGYVAKGTLVANMAAGDPDRVRRSNRFSGAPRWS